MSTNMPLKKHACLIAIVNAAQESIASPDSKLSTPGNQGKQAILLADDDATLISPAPGMPGMSPSHQEMKDTSSHAATSICPKLKNDIGAYSDAQCLLELLKNITIEKDEEKRKEGLDLGQCQPWEYYDHYHYITDSINTPIFYLTLTILVVLAAIYICFVHFRLCMSTSTSIILNEKRKTKVKAKGQDKLSAFERRKFVRNASNARRQRLEEHSSTSIFPVIYWKQIRLYFVWFLLAFNPRNGKALVLLVSSSNGKQSTEDSSSNTDTAAAGVPTDTTTTTTVEYIGHTNNTPIVILNNVLPTEAFLSLEDDLRSRTDFIQGHANDLAFPGKIGIIDRPIVDPLIEAVLADKDVLKHFPKEIFEQREFVRGYASVLCNQSWVHSDYLENEFMGDVVAPAAVFYFGFGGLLLWRECLNSKEQSQR
jgi:hypothetical protein